jgi:predicted ribosome quality control (RQC) complex YloA/Tae2 family protein
LFPPREAHLTISASAKRPYVALLDEKLPVPPAPPRFCQLVRSRLEGGGVESFSQVGNDRVVRLVVRRREDDGDHRYELVAELFGPQADMYMFDLVEGRALGRLRNGPMLERLVNGYAPPEAPARPSALGMDAGALAPFVERALGEGPAVLFRELDAVPPGLAKLALAIAKERGAGVAADALAAHLARIAAHAYEPALAEDGAGAREVLLAPLDPLPSGFKAVRFESFAAMARQVMVEDVRTGDLTARRGAAGKQLAEMRTREEERRRHTRENLKRCDEADTMERWGNLLKGQLAAIQPYRDAVEVQDWYEADAPMVRIPLKKNLPPRANVERYFLKAKKLRHSVPALEARMDEHEANLDLIAELEDELARVEGREQLEGLEERIRGIGRVAKGGKARTEAAARPLEFVSSDGYRILVGRNNRENDLLSRKMAKGHDMWLHARGMAGAHVVVRMPRKDEECPPGTLEEAAQLAAHYSKGRYAAKVEVTVARAAHVKKAPGAPPGQVLVEGGRTLMVRTDPQAPQRLAKPI